MLKATLSVRAASAVLPLVTHPSVPFLPTCFPWSKVKILSVSHSHDPYSCTIEPSKERQWEPELAELSIIIAFVVLITLIKN